MYPILLVSGLVVKIPEEPVHGLRVSPCAPVPLFISPLLCGSLQASHIPLEGARRRRPLGTRAPFPFLLGSKASTARDRQCFFRQIHSTARTSLLRKSLHALRGSKSAVPS